MNKKVFIKNRPFDEIDANEMVTWMEDSANQTVSNMFSPGVLVGLEVTPVSGLNISIGLGKAYDANYKLINVISNQNVLLATANPTNPRIDLVTIKFNTSTVNNTDTTNKYGMGTGFIYSQNIIESFIIEVVAGTPASSPVVPSTPSGNIALAEVYVSALASSLIVGNITDKRAFYVITDEKINYRVINDTVVPLSNSAFITNQFSGLANRIKAVTGKTDWKTAPAITLETISSYLNQSGAATFASMTITAPLPLGSGGTGSTTKNFVDLTTAQTIAGVKTFSGIMQAGHIRPAVADVVGFANNADTFWILRADDSTGALTSRVNTLDDGAGAATLKSLTLVNAPLPLGSGGTGSVTKNFVDLTTSQTIAGVKTFSSDINVTGKLKPGKFVVPVVVADPASPEVGESWFRGDL